MGGFRRSEYLGRVGGGVALGFGVGGLGFGVGVSLLNQGTLNPRDREA